MKKIEEKIRKFIKEHNDDIIAILTYVTIAIVFAIILSLFYVALPFMLLLVVFITLYIMAVMFIENINN